ncbi:hypothetical protein HN51_011479 [Arachis hypogaea]
MDELLVDSDDNDVEDLLLNNTGSIGRVNFVGLSVDAAKKYVFSDLDVAYAFYNAFGRVNRFSIRKFKGLPFAACGDLGDFKDVMEWVRNKKAKLFAKHEKNREGSSNSARHNHRNCRHGDDHNQMESGDGGGPKDDDDWSSQTNEEGDRSNERQVSLAAIV